MGESNVLERNDNDEDAEMGERGDGDVGRDLGLGDGDVGRDLGLGDGDVGRDLGPGELDRSVAPVNVLDASGEGSGLCKYSARCCGAVGAILSCGVDAVRLMDLPPPPPPP